jgi:hypothetical protein
MENSMSETDSKSSLNVVFEFPGKAEVITIHVNRTIGIGDNNTNLYQYSLVPELETVLSTIDGLQLSSIWTSVERCSITTERFIAFDPDELCFNIALALGEYYGVDNRNVHIGTTIDNRPLRNLMH